MADVFLIFEGDLSPAIADTIKIDGAAVDLSPGIVDSVTFSMRPAESDTPKISAATATILSPETAGNVRYDWSGTDTDTAGDYLGWWTVTYTAGSKPQSTDEFPIRVAAHVHDESLLCTIADVRLEMRLLPAERHHDSLIDRKIREASALIMSDYQREFAPPTPTSDVVRRFLVDGRDMTERGLIVDLAPSDLRTLTSAKLHPGETNETTLTADDHFTLEPLDKEWGVWSKIRVADHADLSSEYASRFGRAVLEIEGAWGFPAVPADVQYAAVTTVKSWLDRPTSEYAIRDADTNPRETFAESGGGLHIPSDARRALRPFERKTMGLA